MSAHRFESWRICAIAAFVLAFSVSGSLAGERPDCPVPITFGLYENGYIYDTATHTGIDKDVAEELAQRSGCRFEFLVKPRARIWSEIENGALMMTGSGIQTEKRDAFCWGVRYMAQKNYVLIKSEVKAGAADQFAADPTLLWGAVRSYKHGEVADTFLDGLRQKSRVVEEADLAAVFRIFATPRRTSALLAPPPAYAKYVNDMGLASRIRVVDWFPQDQPIPHSLIFSKKAFSESELKKWRAIITQMRTDGTLKAIYKKYLGAVDAERMLQYAPE